MTKDDYGWLEMTRVTKDYYEWMRWLGMTGITRVDKKWLGMTTNDFDDYISMTKDD